MIIANNVTKSFRRVKALDNISVNCLKSQCIALIGPNGSGKTTFIKCLLGMVKPDSGFITFNQQNIALDWKYRQQIGYMPQIGRFPDNMSIAQVIDMMKDIRKQSSIHLDEELIESFGLKKILNNRMRTLSGGTRQKVSASLAFLFDPAVLILDEPTAGLDPLSAELLKKKIIQEKKKDKLILITSYVLSDLEDIITEVMYLQEGALRFHKSFDQLQKDTGETKLSAVIARLMKGNSH